MYKQAGISGELAIFTDPVANQSSRSHEEESGRLRPYRSLSGTADHRDCSRDSNDAGEYQSGDDVRPLTNPSGNKSGEQRKSHTVKNGKNHESRAGRSMRIDARQIKKQQRGCNEDDVSCDDADHSPECHAGIVAAG